MSYEMTAEQVGAILTLPPEQRFDYFVERVVEYGELWSLAEGDAWMVLSDEGEDYLPVWPHPDLAAAWAGDAHQGSAPKAIPLSIWLERWAPGMEADGTLLAVCPGEDPDGVVVEAVELKVAFEQAMKA